MSRKRATEDPKQRSDRIDENARKQREDADAAEAEVDERIKRNIEKHGP